MNFTEDINRLKQTEKQLAFVKNFLDEHSDAELYLVGGTVRDLIMNRLTPHSIPPRGGWRNGCIDFDFVIRGLEPEMLEDWFSKRGEINLVGKTFGVLRFMPEGMDPSSTSYIDIALPRTERALKNSSGGYHEFSVQSDANLPIEDDLARRDFTMNAMAINIRTGELVDPFDGTLDIGKRTISAVGDPQNRFDEDLSRILRAIRFASELHFDIEEKTLEAIRENVGRVNDTHGEPPKYVVSRETVGSELGKALAVNPDGAARWLTQTGAMGVLFGETTSDISNVPEGNPTLAVVLLLRANDRNNIPNILSMSGLDSLPRDTKLRIEPETVVWLVERLNEPWSTQAVGELHASTFEKYFMGGRASMLLQALELTENSSASDAAKNRASDIRDRWGVDDNEPISPLLSGNDVIAAGIPAGPKVRETLEALRDEQLDGRVLTREQAKQWLKDKSSSDGVKE